MARLANSVLFVPTLGGTTDFVVSAAVQGFMTPALAGMVAGTYKYRAESADLSQWEEGEGTYIIGTTTLGRGTVLYNSAGTGTATGQSGAGTKINFASAPNVGVVALKDDLLLIEEFSSWTDNQKSQARINIGATVKEYIVNGGMLFSQENGTTAVTGNQSYPADKFAIAFSSAGAAAFTTANVASVTPAGNSNRIRVTVTAAQVTAGAGDICTIRHTIQGRRAIDLRLGTASAKYISLRFGVKAPAGTYSLTLRNAGGSRSYATTFTISAGEANTDVVKFVSFQLDQSGTWLTAANVGIYVDWGLMVGSSFTTATTNTWQALNAIGVVGASNLFATNGNVFELFDVSFVQGNFAQAQPFAPFEHQAVLQACQEEWYSTNPAVPKGASVGSVSGITIAGNAVGGNIKHPTQMVITPTCTLWNNGVQNQVRTSPTGAALAVAGPTFNVNAYGVWAVLSSGSPFAANVTYDFDVIANARLI